MTTRVGVDAVESVGDDAEQRADRVERTGRAELPGALTPTTTAGCVCAVVVAALGLAFGRPDVVVLAAPLVLCLVWTLVRGGHDMTVRMSARATDAPRPTWAQAEISVTSEADMVQLSLLQGVHRRAVVLPGHGTFRVQRRLIHSGPVPLVDAIGRGLDDDGAIVGPVTGTLTLDWHAMPPAHRLPETPVAHRLTGLHGSHGSRRLGQGGDFRDIHAFAPGDELRRVDWKATARLARRPGDLLVRRTDALSDASVVLVVDNAEDLGEAVSTWGSDDAERTGITSLDLAREAARTIAEAAIASGDRVAYHEISPGGRSLRGGSGQRHLSRVLAAIAATGPREQESRMRRTPPTSPGSAIYIMSTFFDGAAAQMALAWSATGHRVIAVDVLPRLDDERLTRQQGLALRLLLSERRAVFADLDGAGIELVRWSAEPSGAIAELGLSTRRRR